MRRNWVIVKVFPVLMLMVFGACNGSSQNVSDTAVEHVSEEEFKAKMEASEDAQVLDIRTPAEWEAGIIPGAYTIDWYSSNFKQEVEALDKEKPLLVYCRSGGRSSDAVSVLEELGFTEIYNLQGGMNAWSSAGNEVVH